jgi:hypothetical protein
MQDAAQNAASTVKGAAASAAGAAQNAAGAAVDATKGAAQSAADTAGWAADTARTSWEDAMSAAHSNWVAGRDKSKQVNRGGQRRGWRAQRTARLIPPLRSWSVL